MKVDKRGVMAAGPWFKTPGMLRCRVVLRALDLKEGVPTEFVVHVQGAYEDDKHAGFSSGDYFPVRSWGKGGSAVMSAYEAALKRFTERTLEKCLDLTFDCLVQHPAAV